MYTVHVCDRGTGFKPMSLPEHACTSVHVCEHAHVCACVYMWYVRTPFLMLPPSSSRTSLQKSDQDSGQNSEIVSI